MSNASSAPIQAIIEQLKWLENLVEELIAENNQLVQENMNMEETLERLMENLDD